MFLRSLILLIAPIAVMLPAQVSVGVVGGVPLLPVMRSSGSSSRAGFSYTKAASRPYTIGASIDVPLYRPLAMESGVMFKRLGFDSVGQVGNAVTSHLISATKGNTWEVPIMAKLRIWFPARVKGYIAGGPVIRHVTHLRETGTLTVIDRTVFPNRTEITAINNDHPDNMARRTSIGASLATGIEFQTGPLLLAPGFRFTYWDTPRTGPAGSTPRFERKQADLQLLIAYATRSGPRNRVEVPGQFRAGILVGASILDGFEIPAYEAASTVNESTPLAAGALIEWIFRPRLSIEASFLSRRAGYRKSHPNAQDLLRARVWEAPLLLHWQATRILHRPLVLGIGPAIRRVSDVSLSYIQPNQSLTAGGWGYRRVAGISMSAGLQLGSGRLRWRPELRYSHFAASNRSGSGYPAATSVSVLLAITAGGQKTQP